jgi:drug/metabolite transporter (DMT)-like permease
LTAPACPAPFSFLARRRTSRRVAFAGAFVNLVAAFGALMAVGLLGEPFAAYHVVALALAVGGVAIAPRQRLAGAGRRGLSTGKAEGWASGSS